MNDAVSRIYASGGDHKSQLEQLAELLKTVYNGDAPQSTDVTVLTNLVEAVVNKETGSLVVSRQFLGLIDQALEERPPTSQKLIEIVNSVLNVTQSRAISYEDQVTSLRLKLSHALETERRWCEAASALLAINLESSQRSHSSSFKMEMYLRMGQLYLEGDATDDAESSATRASLLQAEAKDEELNIEHKALMARVLDRRRRFIEAAQRYYELSQCAVVPSSDQLHAISAAMTCTILAAPGTQRTRLLAKLRKEERAKAIPSYTLLEKLFLERLIKVDELLDFEKDLKTWQRNFDNGQSIIRGVMVEHNMTAVGQVYSNIDLTTLAALLGVNEQEAERVAAQMISSDRLKGNIDQIGRYLHFAEKTAIEMWDDQIELFCRQVERAAEMIIARHPELDI
ncbi:unnamed protein product, partial [Mesorhabditis belari]|uniref:COP9 signalosome complex subunit 4 n=1 Tax=Mesorhabditis belari TaxID=2138241 RepID=A0AAF3FC99_9BILA